MIGATLGHYRIQEKLGQGGMGEVYAAEDTRLKRRVAIKLLPPEASSDPDRLERFQREAEAVAALSHPNIVTIHSVEEAVSDSGESVGFLTMELVDGRTLEQSIPSGGLDRAPLLDLAIQIAEALAAAHAKGITHRDLKPANVMVTESGLVKVLDFGLAKLADATAPPLASQAPTKAITREGTILGTYPYMSPEQVEGKPLDPRTDVFSLGILLYEMATGVRPFRGDSSAALISAILKDEAEPIENLKEEVPRHLGRIVRLCLRKDPDRRFQSALDVRNELDELRRELDSADAVTAASGVSAAGRPVQRRRRRLLAPFALGAAVVALLAWLVVRDGADPASQTRDAPTVAVLPFQNLAAEPTIDFLRLSIPDEVTTTLSRAPGLVVRPFATTAGYSTEGLDAAAAGKAVAAANVITGQFFAQGQQLQLTLEAIDVRDNRVVWRESVTGTVDDLIAMRGSVSERVREGLLPLLGAVDGAAPDTAPTNEEAYRLYLRGLATVSDLAGDRRAIELLEQAVELDPSYAPAWTELARRYYYDGNFGLVGRARYDDALDAARRALDLDPDYIRAAVRIVTIQVEMGELEEALVEAQRLLVERPESAEAHHAMAYALRYGGLVEEALEECERALEVDPTNPRLRLCGIPAYLAGAYDRAEVFLRLDGSSHIFFDNLIMLRLRQGRPAEALELLLSDPSGSSHRAYLELCLGREVPLDRVALADQIEIASLSQLDGEQQYWGAALMGYCGEPERSLRLLEAAIERGYCSFPAMTTDPLLEGLVGTPGYADLVEAGRACHEGFVEQVTRIRDRGSG